MIKIFVVEDEGIIANNLAENLQRSGYEICGISASGEDAIGRVGALKPDLVLMDIHLSGKMDGIETAEKVRAEFSIPVIFLTAYANQEVLERAKRTHPFGYLVKPIRQVELVSTIEIAVFKHAMERKLKQREAWLTTTLRCTGDGVVVTDAEGRIEFLNDLSKRILSIPDGDVVGERFGDVVRLTNKFTGSPAGNLVNLAILGGRTMSIGSDLILVDAFNQETDLEGEIALCETDGAIVGAVFTFRDVTVRNHHDNQRRQDTGTRACARLAGTVSGELRTLLPLSREGEEGSSQSNAPAGGVLYSHAISRIADQLDLIRARSTSFPCTLNLNDLVSEVCGELLSSAPANVTLTTSLQPELDPVYADPVQIKQAMATLIVHAQESMPNGGTIHINSGSSAFYPYGKKAENESYVKLTLEYTSCHASTEVPVERMGEWFEPAAGAIDHLELKLFMVHEIISGAGGSIRAKVRPCAGTGFEILLPTGLCKTAKILPATAVGEQRQEAIGILLLHGDHAVRSLISESLEHQGYEVLGARDVAEASEWMSAYPGSIALLIADLEPSDPRGIALASEIASRWPGMKVMLISSGGVDPSHKSVWQEHGVRLLERPFRLEKLLNNVNELVPHDSPAAASVEPMLQLEKALALR